MTSRSSSQELRTSLRNLGFDKGDIDRIVYNVKCGLSVKAAMERLGLLVEPETHVERQSKKVTLYELRGDDYIQRGKVDVSKIVAPNCILRTNYRYVWFTLFGKIYRYRKQNDNSETCYL